MERPKYDLKAMLAEIEKDGGLDHAAASRQVSQDEIAALFAQAASDAPQEPCEPTTRS